jgi:hypothetical protein
VNEARQREATSQLGELPYSGASLSLRLECCLVDLPARVLSAQGTQISVTAPVHMCKRQELGARVTAIWDCKTGIARSTGTVESQRRLPPTWVLNLDGAIEHLTLEERYPDDSPGMLDIGDKRVPARVVDRSLNGVGCLVPALVRLRPGQRVNITVGRHDRAGTIARVQPLHNQLRVGIRLDEI